MFKISAKTSISWTIVAMIMRPVLIAMGVAIGAALGWRKPKSEKKINTVTE